ncbi:MAG TPA: hypothetical protein VJ183_15200 [Chloroflexia bacterium]|nr:hypothetical protein [Chloroflexia bacterium]
MIDETLVFNGINGSSGEYLLPPLTTQELATLVRQKGSPPNEVISQLRWRNYTVSEDHLSMVETVEDPQDLAQAGWGVIFPAAMPEVDLAALRSALKPLLDRRKAQASKEDPVRYKEYSGADGYVQDDTGFTWLPRHGRSPGSAADPDIIPYYLLIIGSPEVIPYPFQYQLDVVYATGRLYFESYPGESEEQRLDKYARYAQSVVEAEEATERGEGFRPRQATFFGVANPDDKATQLSAHNLVAPLHTDLMKRRKDWTMSLVPPEKATKETLTDLLGSENTPSLLFTASHGMSFKLDDSRLEPHHGALLCGDWPGPDEWFGRRIPEEHYFSANDVDDDARLHGMIAFHFACFSGGIPKFDDFGHRVGKTAQIAPRSMVAHLPQRLLSHPKGGALAVIAHVERAWSYSFSWTQEVSSETDTFRDTLLRITRGERIGWAMEHFNDRYAALSTSLSDILGQIKLGRKADDVNLSSIWTANNDARSYVILGDPAARLPLPEKDHEVARPPEINLSSALIS